MLNRWHGHPPSGRRNHGRGLREVAALPGPRDPDAYLFPKNAGQWSAQVIVDCWRTVCADVGLGRLRLHDLRHTAASQAVMVGENLPLVGKLLGHRLNPHRRRAFGRNRRGDREHHRIGDGRAEDSTTVHPSPWCS